MRPLVLSCLRQKLNVSWLVQLHKDDFNLPTLGPKLKELAGAASNGRGFQIVRCHLAGPSQQLHSDPAAVPDCTPAAWSSELTCLRFVAETATQHLRQAAVQLNPLPQLSVRVPHILARRDARGEVVHVGSAAVLQGSASSRVQGRQAWLGAGFLWHRLDHWQVPGVSDRL